MGGKSESKSSNGNYTSTDRRLVADNGSFGLTGDDNAVSWSSTENNALQYADHSTNITNTLDGGAIKSSAEVVKAALETVGNADAVSGEGFSKLLDLAGELFEGGGRALERSQELTNSAYQQAVESKQGAIDNRTIAVLAMAGAAAVIGYAAVKS